MAIGDDLSVAVNGDIRHVSGSTNYTVLELHRWLQDLADDAAASGNDLVDITSDTPSERSTDNIITLNSPYNIDDTLSQYLYGGSIIQAGGDTIYDGIVNFGVQGIYIDVIQNGALLTNFWTTGINPNAGAGISHQFMVKVRDSGADIDGRRLLGTTREFSKTYSEFPINGSNRGNNVLALTNADDLNNQTAEATVATWTTITNTEGYRAIDVNNDSTDEYYYSEWNKDTYTINQFFERMKWLTRRGTASTIYGLSGDLFRGITHEIDVDGQGATDFSAVEAVSWSGGTGQMLAVDDINAASKMWIQLLTGVAPTDGQTITGGTSGATCDVNVTVTARTISTPFVGASTGTAIIGSYGLGIEATDLQAGDSVTDLTNTVRNPPNYVTFTVFGLVSGEDRVLVTNDNAGIDFSQMTLATTLSGAAETQVDVGTGNIPADTPQTGQIRVELDDGRYRLIAYTAHNSDDLFTIGSSDWQDPDDATAGNGVFIAYIDKLAAATSEAFTVVYSAGRTMFVRVRDGGVTPIKTFESTAALGTAGGSATAIRTSDE